MTIEIRGVEIDPSLRAPVRTELTETSERDQRYWELEREPAEKNARREAGRVDLGG